MLNVYEAAFAKLYWTLATQFGSEITAQMQISQRGEQSLNLFDLRYGSSEDLENSGSAMSAKVSPDRRFTRSEMSRAVVRLSGVEFDGVEAGTNCEVKVFMNKPLAGRETPAEDPHCVAHISTAWEGRPTTLLKDVTDRAGAVIGEGAIVLTVVSSVPIRFGGLFLALFART